MSPTSSTITTSEEETAAVAARLAASLRPGSVVLLFGELGAGKTAFVRGMASGLGIDPDEVSSPTFTLIQEYHPATASGHASEDARPVPAQEGRGSITLYHVDLYRVEGGEAEDLGLEELTTAHGIVAIEWAEKLGRGIDGAVKVHIREEGEERRRIDITRPDETESGSFSVSGPPIPTPSGSSVLPS